MTDAVEYEIDPAYQATLRAGRWLVGYTIGCAGRCMGLKGPRGADASIISSNINPSSIMIGEKAADLVRRAGDAAQLV